MEYIMMVCYRGGIDEEFDTAIADTVGKPCTLKSYTASTTVRELKFTMTDAHERRETVLAVAPVIATRQGKFRVYDWDEGAIERTFNAAYTAEDIIDDPAIFPVPA